MTTKKVEVRNFDHNSAEYFAKQQSKFEELILNRVLMKKKDLQNFFELYTKSPSKINPFIIWKQKLIDNILTNLIWDVHLFTFK